MATPEPAVGLDEAEEQEAASPPQPVDVEEVAGFAGTMESAIEAGLLVRPRIPLTWHRWQIWRSATESRPAANRVGGLGSTAEAALWRRIMLHYHGESWQKEARELKDADWHEFLASAAASPELLNTARDWVLVPLRPEQAGPWGMHDNPAQTYQLYYGSLRAGTSNTPL